MKHRPFVLLDIETTGGDPKRARITEIGALRIENATVVSTYKQLINPECQIPSFITNLTGITNEMLWSAPTFNAVASQLESFLDGAIFVAHHAAFDYGFINKEFKNIGINYKSDRLCSVQLSRMLHPEHTRHSLDHLIQRLNIEVKNRHRAYDDAEVIWKFFEEELNQDPYRLFIAINKLIKYTR